MNKLKVFDSEYRFMKKNKIVILVVFIIISGIFLAYKALNTNIVPFSYVLRTFTTETKHDESVNLEYIIKSTDDFSNFLLEFNIDATTYENSIDFAKDFLLIRSYYGSSPYLTYSQTIKNIEINKDHLQFAYNKNTTVEIFACSYIDSNGYENLAQRYTEVILISNRYLEYVKDFAVYSKFETLDKDEISVIKYEQEYSDSIFHYSASDLEGIQLFALNKYEPDLSFEAPLADFILSVDGINKVFRWAGHNIDRQPEIFLTNNSNHIAVITNSAAGTGIHGQKFYAVNKHSLEEIPVMSISEYLKNNVEFTVEDKNLIISSGESRWYIPNFNLNMADLSRWANENNKSDEVYDLRSYYEYAVESAVEYHSYYIVSDESVKCLVAVENIHIFEPQAIGGFQFNYSFDGDRYIIDNMEFGNYYDMNELNNWIDSGGVYDNEINPFVLPVNNSEPFYGHMELDDETGIFCYGTWKIKELIELGRKHSGTPESTWPPIEEIVGAEIIMEKEYFSTMEINYKPMQFLREPRLYPYQSPQYCIEWIFYNETSFYRCYKTDYPNSDINDKIKVMYIDSPPNWGDVNLIFFIVNNEKMFLIFDGMLFEMEKVIDK